MKILFLHDNGRAQGSGATIALHTLHRGLLAAGHDSKIACIYGDFDRADLVRFPQPRRAEKLLEKVTWRIGLNDVHCLNTFRIPDLPAFREADVVNIHGWHSAFFNYLALPKITREKPTVATFHDMWNMTGHCSYSFDCERWKTGCGKCPYLETYPPVHRDATALEWKLKNRSYRRSDFEIVVGSRWLQSIVRQSMLGDVPVHWVPYGINTEMYRPLDRALSRDALEIPQDRNVILFAAAALTNRTKGGDLLLEALKVLPERVRQSSSLLLFGDSGEGFERAAGMPVHSLGYVFSDRIKALAYSAADIFILPSRAEVQGLVLLEAMACETPCVGFDVGGVPEVVIPGQTGYLARPEDPADLAAGMAQLLEDGSRRAELGRNGRAFVRDRYTMQSYIGGYLEVYRRVIAARAGAAEREETEAGGERQGMVGSQKAG